MRHCLIILLFISSICNAQEKSVFDNMLKIYKLVPDTAQNSSNSIYCGFSPYKVDTVLHGEISKEMIKRIDIEKGYKQGNFRVNINLKKTYWGYYQSITENLVGSPMGIIFNGELISSPIVNMPISEGMLGFNVSSKDKAELIHKSLSGKFKNRVFVEKKLPYYHNEDFYPDGESLLEQNVPVDSIFLLYANAILSTPDDNSVDKRNDIFNDIGDWFEKNSGKEYLLGKKSDREKGIELNSYTLKFVCADTLYVENEEYLSYDNSIVMYYIVCLTKAFTENKNLSDTEVKIKATEYLIEYIFQKQNYSENSTLSYEKIKDNKYLKSLKNRKNIRRLIEGHDSD